MTMITILQEFRLQPTLQLVMHGRRIKPAFRTRKFIPLPFRTQGKEINIIRARNKRSIIFNFYRLSSTSELRDELPSPSDKLQCILLCILSYWWITLIQLHRRSHFKILNFVQGNTVIR